MIFPARARFPGHSPWYVRILSPGFRHCFLARADGDERTICLDHGGQVMLVETFDVPLGHWLRMVADRTGAFMMMVPPIAAPRRAKLRGPMTCVEAVKAVLGITPFWIVTPRQLARHLRRRHGALPVFTCPPAEE